MILMVRHRDGVVQDGVVVERSREGVCIEIVIDGQTHASITLDEERSLTLAGMLLAAGVGEVDRTYDVLAEIVEKRRGNK